MTVQERLKVKCCFDQPTSKPWNVGVEAFIDDLSITSSYQTGKLPGLLTPISVLFKNTKIAELNEQNEQLT